MRPTTLVSGGPGRRRWEFLALPGESIDELNSEATAWRLLALWNVTPQNATLERHALYRFQARWLIRGVPEIAARFIEWLSHVGGTEWVVYAKAPLGDASTGAEIPSAQYAARRHLQPTFDFP